MNVLWLLSDEHSFRFFSHLDADGEGEQCRTPAFDRLASESCAFDRAYCQVPLCTPSRICMLTGRPPMGSGGWGNSAVLRPGAATIPSAFAEAGYATCLVGKMHLGGDRQFVGFGERPYGDLTGDTGHQWEPLHRRGGREMLDRIHDAGVTEIPESALQERITAEETVAWVREQHHGDAARPWLLCASFSRPHFPLTAPRRHFERYWPEGVTPPKVGRAGDTADHPMTRGMAEGFKTEQFDESAAMKARAGYFACVDALDEIIGDMLRTLDADGLLDNTIIVYTSDHGELAGEHGMWWKNSWHEAAARVPLMVSLPDHRSGRAPATRWRAPVSLEDLFPTLCGLCDVSAPGDLPGTDLSRSVHGEGEPERGPVYYDNPTPRWGEGSEHRAVVDGRFKYVLFRSMSPNLLFDLELDPLEQRNLVNDPGHAETRDRLHALVERSYDFDAAERQCETDRKLRESHKLDVAHRAGNLYHMPRGVVVDAEAPLYNPLVATDRPAETFGDFPAGKP